MKFRLRYKRISDPKLQKAYHGCHSLLHLGYFALVYIEGHGWYSVAAGGLFVLSLAAPFIAEDV